MKVHKLKILPKFFKAQVKGIKTFEIRLNDRDFEVGDILNLCEWKNEKFTGSEVRVEVVYMIDWHEVQGLEDCYVILGTRPVQLADVVGH